jgi:FOG: WD40 repeat
VDKGRIKQRRPLTKEILEEKTVWSVCFSPDDRLLASAGSDGYGNNTVRLWNLTTGKHRILADISGNAVKIAFGPDGKTLAASNFNEIQLFDVASGVAMKKITSKNETTIRTFAFSPDGKVLVSAGNDRKICFWDAVSGATIRTIAGHKSTINSIAFSPDGKMLASGGDNGKVKVWNVQSGQLLKTF